MKEPTSVLVVDDNPDLLNTFALILKRKGYDVEMARDGATAVSKFESRRFDIILMDIIMPGLNGIEAFSRMRELDPEVKVILMTAYYEEDQISNALERGLYSAIHKPVNIGKLIELITHATVSPLVLVVDDDSELRFTLSRVLEVNGFRVATAGSAAEAEKIMREQGCRLAFIDIKMPDSNGLQTYLKLREMNPELVGVMMTGYGSEVSDLIAQALIEKAAKCLYKPLDPEEVITLAGEISHYHQEQKDAKREHTGSR